MGRYGIGMIFIFVIVTSINWQLLLFKLFISDDSTGWGGDGMGTGKELTGRLGQNGMGKFFIPCRPLMDILRDLILDLITGSLSHNINIYMK